jgi:D-sedoheptulose 7-phosphate isomerase
MDFVEYAKQELDANIAAHQGAREFLCGDLERALSTIYKAVKNNQCLLVCGNGGSATDSLHIAAELVGRFRLEGRPYGAVALVENIAAVTAIANDYSYEEMFARQVEAFGRHGDILLALSTSGNSANVLRACTAARQIGMTTIALTGASGGQLALRADIAIRVPSNDTAHIQEVHETIGHIIAGVAEMAIRGDVSEPPSRLLG